MGLIIHRVHLKCYHLPAWDDEVAVYPTEAIMEYHR